MLLYIQFSIGYKERIVAGLGRKIRDISEFITLSGQDQLNGITASTDLKQKAPY
jgi:hypothetical protein